MKRALCGWGVLVVGLMSSLGFAEKAASPAPKAASTPAAPEDDANRDYSQLNFALASSLRGSLLDVVMTVADGQGRNVGCSSIGDAQDIPRSTCFIDEVSS